MTTEQAIVSLICLLLEDGCAFSKAAEIAAKHAPTIAPGYADIHALRLGFALIKDDLERAAEDTICTTQILH